MRSGARIRPVAAAVGFFLIAAAGVGGVWLYRSHRENPPATAPAKPGPPADDAVVRRLRTIPLYRSWLPAKTLRSGRIDSEGTLHLEVDVRAVVEPRLAAAGYAGASALFPPVATGTIAFSAPSAPTATGGLRESWSFSGPAPLFELFDRNPVGKTATVAMDALPGSPSAVAILRLVPSRLADPDFGGAPLSPWRERAALAEQLLGRPLRAEIAEDLAGPAVFALYDRADGRAADAILIAELKRSDRLAGVVDMLLGLLALTERATVSRYRGVSTGSLASASGPTGLALAVDGPVLFVASSRARLESAIDARRAAQHPRAPTAAATAPEASWSATSVSAFVSDGWARLAQKTGAGARGPIAASTAALRPEGASGWRLDGQGPGPAITADPMLPFVRSVFGRRQRGPG